jgi:hypothetical protein
VVPLDGSVHRFDADGCFPGPLEDSTKIRDVEGDCPNYDVASIVYRKIELVSGNDTQKIANRFGNRDLPFGRNRRRRHDGLLTLGKDSIISPIPWADGALRRTSA